MPIDCTFDRKIQSTPSGANLVHDDDSCTEIMISYQVT